MTVQGFEAISFEGKRGLLLDIDNTLYAYDPTHKAAQHHAALWVQDKLGISPEEFKAAYAKARERVHHDLHGQAASHSRLLYGQKLIENFLGKTDFALTLELEQAYWGHFLSLMTLLPEAEAMLIKAQAAGVAVCLVTDLTAQIQHQKAIKLGLAPYVQYMVTSEEAGIEKPGAYMFQLGMEKLGLTPAECLMVGDSQAKDIEGAEALGITAYKIVITA